ncbi:hypothetical protein MRX96_042614 [Rhipicephalus microplus]
MPGTRFPHNPIRGSEQERRDRQTSGRSGLPSTTLRGLEYLQHDVIYRLMVFALSAQVRHARSQHASNKKEQSAFTGTSLSRSSVAPLSWRCLPRPSLSNNSRIRIVLLPPPLHLALIFFLSVAPVSTCSGTLSSGTPPLSRVFFAEAASALLSIRLRRIIGRRRHPLPLGVVSPGCPGCSSVKTRTTTWEHALDSRCAVYPGVRQLFVQSLFGGRPLSLMRTVWLLLPFLAVSLAAPLGGTEPGGLIGRRELRRPALVLEAQTVSSGAAGRRQGVLFKTSSNFGGRRRLSAPAGSDAAGSVEPDSSETSSDDAVASLINQFGGVIHQKRRLDDDDAVSEEGDELVARVLRAPRTQF